MPDPYLLRLGGFYWRKRNIVFELIGARNPRLFLNYALNCEYALSSHKDYCSESYLSFVIVTSFYFVNQFIPIVLYWWEINTSHLLSTQNSV